MADNKSTSDKDFGESPGQRAVSARLSRLAAIPVDTTAMDRAVMARIPRPRRNNWPWRMAISGLAAAIILLAVVLTPLLAPRTSQASVGDLSHVYAQMVTNPATVGAASPIGKKMLRMCSPRAGQMGSCCLQTIHHQKVACMLVKHAGQTLGVMVAPISELAYPQGRVVHKFGYAFIIPAAGRLHIVIRPGKLHWVCVMGYQSVNSLMAIAAQLRSVHSGAEILK